MKFFDLEMNDSLAFGRRGGRSVSYAEGSNCDNYKFTGGTNWHDCMDNKYKQQGNEKCEMTLKPIAPQVR